MAVALGNVFVLPMGALATLHGGSVVTAAGERAPPASAATPTFANIAGFAAVGSAIFAAKGSRRRFSRVAQASRAIVVARRVTADELLANANFKSILLHHVVGGTAMSSFFKDGQEVTTANGSKLEVKIGGGKVQVGRATVTGADVACSNGVIHVIDKVLLPPPAKKNIAATAIENGNFGILVAALQKAGLVETVSGETPYTVFAPTDAAFGDLLKELGVTADELLANPDLKSILLHHVVGGTAMSSSLKDGQEVTTANGSKLEVKIGGGKVQVGRATVTGADVACSNGVIHVVDKVLLP